MNQLDVNGYLSELIGIVVEDLAPWSETRRLPLGLRQQFRFMAGTVMDAPVLLAFDEGDQPIPAAKVRKQLEQIKARFDGDVVLIRQFMLPYERKRLVQQRVSFIVPGTQLYAPQWGVCFQELFRKAKVPARVELSPSTQALLIHLLMHGIPEEGVGVQAMAPTLQYTNTTLRRAIHELGTLDAFEVQGSGSGRELRLLLTQAPEEAWQSSLAYLRSPLLRTVEVLNRDRSEILNQLPLAGLSALAAQTMLAPPTRPVRAIASEAWSTFAQTHGLQEAAPDDPDATVVQCWRYDPTLLATGDSVDSNLTEYCVDPFSLYLSLSHEEDERVQIALEELMKDRQW